MVFKSASFLFASLILFLMGISSALPVAAGNKNNLLGDDKVVTDKQDVDEEEQNAIEQTLDHNFSPEDRARLRKALSDYAKSTDPEHIQIEQKRKSMKESIEARFNDCNKDNDDSLDREEVTHCLPQIARHFNYVDVDEDGVITLEELELAQAKQIERQKAEEAKIEEEKIQEAEAAIKNKSKSKVNKQAENTRKRPS
jgi:Ca2+-binding EF-hand superfamily protein